MAPCRRDRFISVVIVCLVLVLPFTCASPVCADDCKKVQNILVLFDASGFMKDKDRYAFLLKQMKFFKDAIPLTADGFFNVGLRHYGLKIGLGCNNTESILAMQPWDPERFLNSFPKTISYGQSSLCAGLRAAAQEAAEADGKTVIIIVGGGNESCNVDPAKTADRVAFNVPDLEVHCFQIGESQEGRFFLKSIAQKCRGTYTQLEEINSPAGWYSWMKRHLVMPCAPPPGPAGGGPVAPRVAPVAFDYNSFSVRSKDPTIDGTNLAGLDAVARFLQSKPSGRVVLHGFSDGKGKPEYNLQLSRRRAEAVAGYLSGTHRISATQISIVPHGVSADTGLPPRRVEFELLDQ